MSRYAVFALGLLLQTFFIYSYLETGHLAWYVVVTLANLAQVWLPEGP